jgi:oligosaccharide repeat unit polymerase
MKLNALIFFGISFLFVFGLFLFPNYGLIQAFILVFVLLYFRLTYLSVKNLSRKRDGFVLPLFLLSNIFWFLFEIFSISFLQGDIAFFDFTTYSPYYRQIIPIDVLTEAIFSIVSFNFFTTLVFYLFKRKRTRLVSSNKLGGYSHIIIDSFLFIFSLSGWYTFFTNAKSFGLMLSNLLLFRSAEYDIEPGFSNYLPILSIVASSLLLYRLIFIKKGNKSIKILGFLLGAILVVFSGTRFKLIYLILPSLITIIFSNKDIISKNFKRKMLIFFTTSLVLISSYQIINRYDSNDSNDFDTTKSISGSGHFLAFCHAIEISKDLNNYFNQTMLSLFVSDMVPRFIWADKPKSEFWEYYNKKLAIAGNVTPSFLGQYYLNWGIIGCFIIAFNFGIWLVIVDNYYKDYLINSNHFSLFFSAFLFCFLFLSFRVYSLNYFFYVVILFFLNKMFKLNFKTLK